MASIVAERMVSSLRRPCRRFCLRCDAGHGAMRGVVLNIQISEAGRPGVSKMSYHQRPHELRLAISSEAEALAAA
jgi:hypothetical protein